MENPFELLEVKLTRIEQMLELLIETDIHARNPDQGLVGNIDECSDWIKKSKSSIYQMTAQRKIPHLKCGKRLLFNKDEISEWLKTGSKMTMSDSQEEVDRNLIEVSINRK